MLPSILHRAQPRTWAASAPMTFELDTLAAIAKQFRAPEIRSILLWTDATVNTTNASDGEEIFDIYSEIKVDANGCERVRLSGPELRIVDIYEYGYRFRDPINIAASQTAAIIRPFLWIPCAPEKARRPRDFYINVDELVNGGQITIMNGDATPGTASGFSAFAGTSYLFFDVVEGFTRETKSHCVWKSDTMTNIDDRYVTNGFLRYALAYVGAVNEYAATHWVAAKTWSSSVLGLNQIDEAVLRQRYYQESIIKGRYADESGDPASEDPVDLLDVIPIRGLNRDHSTFDLQWVDSFDLRSNDTLPSNSPKMIQSIIRPNGPDAYRKAFQTDNPGVKDAAEAGGLLSGSNLPAAKTDVRVRASMPIRLAGDGQPRAHTAPRGGKGGC